MASPAPRPPAPSIEETLLSLAADHSTGARPIDMIFIFALTNGSLDAHIHGAVNSLMLRGVIAQIHDNLSDLEDDAIEQMSEAAR